MKERPTGSAPVKVKGGLADEIRDLKRQLAASVGREEGKQVVIAQLESELAALRVATKALTDMYAHIWDRADGCIVLMPQSVKKFEKAHAAACFALKPEAT